MILVALCDVEMPTNTEIIFSALMSVAAFEAIPTETIYFELFDSDPDAGNPLTPVFEAIGFEHHLLLNNFGTLGVSFFAIMPFFYFLYLIVA